MKRSPFPITALSCLLIACLLPGHFTQILEEVAQARPLVSAQRTHAEVTEIKAEVPDISAKAPGINGNSLLSQREQEFDPLRFHQNKPLPKPTTPQNPPSKKIEASVFCNMDISLMTLISYLSLTSFLYSSQNQQIFGPKSKNTLPKSHRTSCKNSSNSLPKV
jgi:hypothetical protein